MPLLRLLGEVVAGAARVGDIEYSVADDEAFDDGGGVLGLPPRTLPPLAGKPVVRPAAAELVGAAEGCRRRGLPWFPLPFAPIWSSHTNFLHFSLSTLRAHL